MHFRSINYPVLEQILYLIERRPWLGLIGSPMHLPTQLARPSKTRTQYPTRTSKRRTRAFSLMEPGRATPKGLKGPKMRPMPIACEYPQGSCGCLEPIGCRRASAQPLGAHHQEIACPWGLALMLATIRRRAECRLLHLVTGDLIKGSASPNKSTVRTHKGIVSDLGIDNVLLSFLLVYQRI